MIFQGWTADTTTEPHLGSFFEKSHENMSNRSQMIQNQFKINIETIWDRPRCVFQKFRFDDFLGFLPAACFKNVDFQLCRCAAAQCHSAHTHGAKHSPSTSPHGAPSGQSGGSSQQCGLDPFDPRFSPSNEWISKKLGWDPLHFVCRFRFFKRFF